MRSLSPPFFAGPRTAVDEALAALGIPDPHQVLASTSFGKLLGAGAPTTTIYYVMPSGRVRSTVGIEDPDRPGCYLTPKQHYGGYPLGCWTGNLTAAGAVADWISRTAQQLETAKTRVARLERALIKYEAAAERLAAGDGG